MTIYDIAEKAGVSAASVSRYFNHPELLSQRTWQSIDAVILRNGFKPGRVSKQMILSERKTIGVLMNDMQHQRFAIIASSLERAFFQMECSTIFCNTSNNGEKTQKYLEMLSSSKVDALVLIGSRLGQSNIADLLSGHLATIPIITMDLEVALPNCYSVMVDHTYGIELAVNHLLMHGHEHLAFVACTESPNTERKIESFRNALNIRRLPIHGDGNVVKMPLSLCDESSMDVAGILRGVSEKFSGIIFSHEMMATRAVGSLQFHGYSVPGDYAVVGYDSTPLGQCCQPTLTTIDTQLAFTSRVISNLILDLFRGNEVSQKMIVTPRLVERGSTLG